MTEKPILFSGAMVRSIRAGTKTQTRRVVKPPRSWITPYADGDAAKGFELFHTEVTGGFWIAADLNHGTGDHWQCGDERLSPNYLPGDRLWVKETFALCTQVDGNGFPTDRPYLPFAPLQDNPKFKGIGADYIIYRADGDTEFADEDGDLLVRKDGTAGSLWKPSIFMCREYSRITIEIVSVRVERLQNISEEDAMAEGICRHVYKTSADTTYVFSHMTPQEMLDSECSEVGKTARAAYQILWESINGPGSWALNPWVWVIEFKRL